MSQLFRPKLEEIVPIGYENIKDGVLDKKVYPDGKSCDYTKCFVINGVRYFVQFIHGESYKEGLFSVHFGLTDSKGNPLTNFGLKVFGEIVDEMVKVYEEVMSEHKISQLLIKASEDAYSKEEMDLS